MLPPSATLGVAVRVTVVVSTVSVTAVTAAAGLATRLSKLPPLVAVIVAETLPASAYTSSVGAGTDTLFDEVPATMTICAPFDSVTVTSVPAALLSVAV